MELKKVMDHADAVKESVINHRRKIHTFAELGGKEFKTKKIYFKVSEKVGFAIRRGDRYCIDSYAGY